MLEWFLPLCMPLHRVCPCCLRRPEEDVRSLRPGVTDSHQLSWGWELGIKLGSSRKAAITLIHGVISSPHLQKKRLLLLFWLFETWSHIFQAGLELLFQPDLPKSGTFHALPKMALLSGCQTELPSPGCLRVSHKQGYNQQATPGSIPYLQTPFKKWQYLQLDLKHWSSQAGLEKFRFKYRISSMQVYLISRLLRVTEVAISHHVLFLIFEE